MSSLSTPDIFEANSYHSIDDLMAILKNCSQDLLLMGFISNLIENFIKNDLEGLESVRYDNSYLLLVLICHFRPFSKS